MKVTNIEVMVVKNTFNKTAFKAKLNKEAFGVLRIQQFGCSIHSQLSG